MDFAKPTKMIDESGDSLELDNDEMKNHHSHQHKPTKAVSSDDWILTPRPNPDAPYRLFCFPYLGGGTMTYYHWPATLSPDIELCAVRLPGRESRINEPLFTNLTSLVQALAKTLQPWFDRPFALFGHSMGSKICFEFARQLRRESLPEPMHLFVSGGRAPHRPNTSALPNFNSPDHEFLYKLQKLNGIPEEILLDSELMKFFLPTLRADTEMHMTHVYEKEAPLSCSITAFCGLNDPIVTYEDIAAWDIHTTREFNIHVLPGEHFFLSSSGDTIINIISESITK